MEALKVIVPIYFVVFVLGGFRNIKMFLLLTGIVSLPFRTTYTLIDVGPYIGWTNGINIALSDVSFICLYIYLLITRTRFEGISKRLVVALALFVTSVFLSLVNTTWARVSLFEAMMVVQVFFLYYVVMTAAIETPKELRLVILMLMLSLIVQGAFGTVQYLTGREFDVFKTGTPVTEETPEGLVTRALGTVGKPNGLAMYVTPLILLVTAILMRSRGFYRKLGIVAVSAGGLALLFSFSRGGWLAFAVAFMVLLFGFVRGGYVSTRGAILAFLAAGVVAIIFFPLIQARLISPEGSEAALDRVYLIKIAWNMIKESPILGIGANTFMSVVNTYTRGPELSDVYLHMVHNQYLLVFAETGIVGILAFLWLLIACFKESWACAKSGTGEFSQMIGLSVTAAFIGMLTHMMVDMFASPMCLSLLFVFCSLCSASMKVYAPENLPGIAAGGPVLSAA